MAFTDRVEWFIGILEDGQIELRRTRAIVEDGKDLTKIHDRRVLSPGDATAGLPARIRQVAQLIWTPQVVSAWNEKKAAIAARVPPPTR
jgi:hypothetical protein